MRIFCLIAVIFHLSACAKQRAHNEIWRTYDWLPADAEYSNPYDIPSNDNPYYDNDADYIQPHGWGMCNGSNNLGSC